MPKRLTRRDVFALTSASLASPSLFAQQQENRPADAPDLVVLNARVITVNPRQPHAEVSRSRNRKSLLAAAPQMPLLTLKLHA